MSYGLLLWGSAADIEELFKEIKIASQYTCIYDNLIYVSKNLDTFVQLQISFSLIVRKFVYQKDISEHCRRRVVPSVFLGRHVVEAHSKIVYFSKLELPYSCFISVRGESGSNIILVVQLTSEEDLVRACARGPNQLLVYEMGETFGGYWGPIPDTLMRRQWSATNAYVLKANQQKKKTTTSSTTTTATRTETTSSMPPVLRKETQDYIRVEIPLVNVSGAVDTNDLQTPYSFDIDEAFDLMYDVTPHPKEKYDTGLLPLVQFSARNQKSGRRKGEERYDLEVDADLPLEDPVLKFPPYAESYTNEMKITSSNILERKPKNYRSSVKPHRDKPIFYESFFNKLPLKSTSTVNKDLHQLITNNFARHTDLSNAINTHTETVQSWKEIEDFLKMFNASNADIDRPYNGNMNVSNLLHGLTNKKKFNYSAYLYDDLKSLNNFSKGYSTYISAISNFGTFTRKPFAHYTYTTRNIRQFLKTASNERAKKENSPDAKATVKESNLTSIGDIKKAFESYQKAISPADDVLHNTDIDSVTSHRFLAQINTGATENNKEKVSNYTFSNETDHGSTASALVTGSLVDHESWENLVQAAPVMAVLLNQTGKNDTVARKKRTIMPIAIENARPHHRPTKNTNVVTTTVSDFGVSDMQEFAQLVELQDDELHERVALRYLRQYVGPVLFNICETEPKIRHIFLFNSSRIIISLANFTLQRMTVVLTPAHTLLSSTAKCVSSSLECQVAGTRVCIDTMNACNGVPNCGSYDVFDEDRLMCGAAVGLQHNVYLAAITFLAVLLTLLYTVHYWLKRCVPKVSEAFFVYTDRAENILYLESIMRSPYDVDDESNKVVYHGNLFDDDDTLYADSPGQYHRNPFVRFFQRCIAFITCKYRNQRRNKSEQEIGGEFFPPKKMYSFAELELRRMSKCGGVDASVQTGSSLELKTVSKIIKTKATPKRLSTVNSDYEPEQRVSKLSDDDIQSYVNELNMLKFLKKSRTDSSPSSSIDPALLSIQSLRGSRAEEEIKSHIYEPHISAALTPEDIMSGNLESRSNRPGPSKLQEKRLRFGEETIMIRTSDNDDDEEDQPTPLTTMRQKTKGLDTIDEEEPTSSTRDFKRFWGGGRAKKAKKKAHTTLR